MTDTLQRLADISVLAFVVLSMLAMGMSQRLAAVVSPLRDLRTVAAALAINFGVAPLLAVLLTRLVGNIRRLAGKPQSVAHLTFKSKEYQAL